ncbi:hypothetical protein Ferp_1000 [Ferroglobus placidus DSM 10642]|uniref:Uncharacterized protein n=1 Tax=Ferroglobus placidus (strain DSM 10642 / AEDII12DO) TaxID=589924 RepID=D3RXE9_FERPA|nr:hypothetical protein [Ferroglobus placidus]ADC65162.1 hypothetical protein Ferp_1000 [Ferroglobus placidus DSM 10642]
MEEVAKLGDLVLKLEKFGMLFASAMMIFSGLTILFGFNPLYIAVCLTYAGVSIILSSSIFFPLSNFVVDYYGVIALGLIASSIMLLIYLGAFLISFFKAGKSSKEGKQ